MKKHMIVLACLFTFVGAGAWAAEPTDAGEEDSGLVYDAGSQVTNSPSGAEVELKDSGETGNAAQIDKDTVVIEKPYEYDANEFPSKDMGEDVN